MTKQLRSKILPLIFLLQFCVATTAWATPEEGAVRAALVLGFLRYTSWPSLKPNDAIILCSRGDSLAADALSDTRIMPNIQSRAVQFKIMRDDSNIAECSALIIGKSAAPALPENSNTLIICDGCSAQMLDLSVLSLKKLGKRIRFAVNLDNAHTQGIKLSSALINLADDCISSRHNNRGCREQI